MYEMIFPEKFQYGTWVHNCISSFPAHRLRTALIMESILFFIGHRDAWSKLGDMAQEEAMDLYVEELKKVCH